MTTEAVNHQRPAYYRYVQDRQQRRQDHVQAVDQAAREAAPDPIQREHDGRAATRAAVAAFDTNEPALNFDEWKAST